MPDSVTTPDTRPWRKRHPVISRTLLYGLGLGLAVVLFILFTQRREDDERTRIDALQKELDGLSLVLASDPTGEAVLQKLEERFSEPGLPVVTRGRVLRWRAMALRRRLQAARSDAERKAAVSRLEGALVACDRLTLEPAERVALHLEWAEARLERRDVAGALAVLPAPEELRDVPTALLATLLRAQALRLQGRVADSVQLARAAVLGLQGPLSASVTAYVGGREWSAAQVAVELANYVTAVGDPATARGAWNRLRAAAPHDFDTQAGAARGLLRAGAAGEARSAWAAAKAIDSTLAAAIARKDPALETLDEAASQR